MILERQDEGTRRIIETAVLSDLETCAVNGLPQIRMPAFVVSGRKAAQ